jgi:hypothetical protein
MFSTTNRQTVSFIVIFNQMNVKYVLKLLDNYFKKNETDK